MDGACQHPACPLANRAVWACAQLGENGNCIASAQGVVPRGFNQSAVAVEHLAMLYGVAVAGDEVKLQHDCLAVVKAATKPYRQEANPTQTF